MVHDGSGVRTRGWVYTRGVRSHDWIDRRSLALHELVAAKLEADPALLGVARANLTRWLAANPTGALLEWRHVLEVTPLPQVVALLRSTSETAVRLRQSVCGPPDACRTSDDPATL